MSNGSLSYPDNGSSLDNRGMRLGERIAARAKTIGLSQAELARRSGVRQSSMNTLINSNARWSPHLTKIARALHTNVEWLVGDTEDPDYGVPEAPEAEIQHLMLPVALPSERALTQMFAALLEGLPAKASLDERAQLLARRLPIGLSQARDLLPTPPTPARAPARAGASRQKELQS